MYFRYRAKLQSVKKSDYIPTLGDSHQSIRDLYTHSKGFYTVTHVYTMAHVHTWFPRYCWCITMQYSIPLISHQQKTRQADAENFDPNSGAKAFRWPWGGDIFIGKHVETWRDERWDGRIDGQDLRHQGNIGDGFSVGLRHWDTWWLSTEWNGGFLGIPSGCLPIVVRVFPVNNGVGSTWVPPKYLNTGWLTLKMIAIHLVILWADQKLLTHRPIG